MWNSWMSVITIESTGQASSQNPQYTHLKRSMSYRVVRLVPSLRSSESMVIANAGQTASQSLQAMHRSSPFGYLRNACKPRNLGDFGVFSCGYIMVILLAEQTPAGYPQTVSQFF